VLRDLKTVGEIVENKGWFDQAMEGDNRVKEDDKIIFTSIEKKEVKGMEKFYIKVNRVIPYSEIDNINKKTGKTYRPFYPKGSNSTLSGGAGGIGGASPFFLQTNKFTKDEKSKWKSLSGYIDAYYGRVEYVEDDIDEESENLFKDKDSPFTKFIETQLSHEPTEEKIDPEEQLPSVPSSPYSIVNTQKNFLEEDEYWTFHEMFKAVDISPGSDDYIFIEEYLGDSTLNIHDKCLKRYLIKPAKKKYFEKKLDEKTACSLCGKMTEKGYPSPKVDFINNANSTYLNGMKYSEVYDSKTLFCDDCFKHVYLGFYYLESMFDNQYMLVPCLSPDTKEEHIVEMLSEVPEIGSSFKKLKNKLQKQGALWNFGIALLVYHRNSNGYIRFDHMTTEMRDLFINPGDVFGTKTLYDGSPKYVFTKDNGEDEGKWDIKKIHDYLMLEDILLRFILTGNKKSIYYRRDGVGSDEEGKGDTKLVYDSKTYHFYRDPEAFEYCLDPKYLSFLATHKDAFYNFIYRFQPNALSKNVLDQLFEMFLLDKINESDDTSRRFIQSDIQEAMNYYYFLRHILHGGHNLKEEMQELNDIYRNYEKELDREEHTDFEKFRKDVIKALNCSDRDKEELNEYNIEIDKELVYFLLGQFIRKIDNKRMVDSKNTVFEDMIRSMNIDNAKEQIARTILRDNAHIITEMSKENKQPLFDILKLEMKNLFDEDDFAEILFPLTNGYYSKNLLIIKDEKYRK